MADVSSKLKVSELDFDQIKTNLKNFLGGRTTLGFDKDRADVYESHTIKLTNLISSSLKLIYNRNKFF